MKNFVVLLGAVIAMSACVEPACASWTSLNYGGYQPWWNIFAKRNRGMSCEEERLQRFWHDYYDALSHYYCALDHIDWVAYYKNHGYVINAACGGGGPGCPQRIQFAPVTVQPAMSWAVPNGCLQGPPSSPPGMPCCGMPPMGGMPPPCCGMPPGGMMPPMGGGMPPMGGGMPPMGMMPPMGPGMPPVGMMPPMGPGMPPMGMMPQMGHN